MKLRKPINTRNISGICYKLEKDKLMRQKGAFNCRLADLILFVIWLVDHYGINS